MPTDAQLGAVAAAAAEEMEAEREGRMIAAERQTLFSDAVIAIAITLLALELPVPEGATDAELLRSAIADRSAAVRRALAPPAAPRPRLNQRCRLHRIESPVAARSVRISMIVPRMVARSTRIGRSSRP